MDINIILKFLSTKSMLKLFQNYKWIALVYIIDIMWMWIKHDDDMWVDPSEIRFFLKHPFKAIICPNKVWKLK